MIASTETIRVRTGRECCNSRAAWETIATPICRRRQKALFVLSHLVGDLLSHCTSELFIWIVAGHVVDLDVTHAVETAGGNLITDDRKNFHG
ncbi:hypothetical protein GGD67_002765 [Bradyrhizobium sp. IAR9]|uniref:hypothetical protein n=1 Tax=Bradyrhizobium sp. IAR9 TaxID=2663841 RepID=UPI0015CE86F1|nr:hypothetical protein [Bradyrhizobium sp. IAR9]NYG45307.1 hypothetical protein [Bradyrhizobium sp. IAR9]